MEKATMTVKELQTHLGVGRVTAYQLCNSTGFPTIRIGRKVLISCEGLKRWLAEKEGESNAENK